MNELVQILPVGSKHNSAATTRADSNEDSLFTSMYSYSSSLISPSVGDVVKDDDPTTSSYMNCMDFLRKIHTHRHDVQKPEVLFLLIFPYRGKKEFGSRYASSVQHFPVFWPQDSSCKNTKSTQLHLSRFLYIQYREYWDWPQHFLLHELKLALPLTWIAWKW